MFLSYLLQTSADYDKIWYDNIWSNDPTFRFTFIPCIAFHG